MGIEGAFNNVVSLEAEEYISNWLVSMSRLVERGTPQGGVISLLLWIMAVKSILVELDSRGVRVVAYADDMVVLVSGLFPDVISDIMSDALRLISRWVISCGLGLNLQKTELVLFTTRTKVPGLRLAQVKRATVAYYTCRRMFGLKWGLSPRIVRWMYTAIVRPILTYGSLVWWTAMEKRYIVDQLYRDIGVTDP
ncbi:Retrovirus-related Pol polyprotein from type-1 retrotransposable element R1 2 [Eumeta japonica]|uniref:Retrovirus-related Pol polyprotein from type-1 retrotransposable element R1 2 n=1 Tax=Eumeta variegata TaxID=151549 RepID=A0A4C1SD91_EUMVA|nr:Retrovirus-related Pol polyprotein from type-1 retrotransposable element R1 2 [Eumeta japonica]